MRIFISHSSRDLAFVKQLARDLRDALGDEQAVWYDSSNLKGGTQWWREIVAELQNSTVFLLVCSPEAMASDWVNDEIDMAWRRKNSPDKMRFIPLLYRDCKLRFDVENLQVISFRDPTRYQRSLQQLRKALGLPRQRSERPPLHATPPRPSRSIRDFSEPSRPQQHDVPLRPLRPIKDTPDSSSLLDAPSPSVVIPSSTDIPKRPLIKARVLRVPEPPMAAYREDDSAPTILPQRSGLQAVRKRGFPSFFFGVLLILGLLGMFSIVIHQLLILNSPVLINTWPDVAAATPPPPTPDPGFSWYTSATPGFSVEYPTGWQKTSVAGVNGAQFTSTSNVLHATFTELPKNTSADVLIDSDLHNFKAKPGYSDPTSRSNVTIDGESWRKDIAYYQSSTQQKERVEVLAINHHAKAYIIELLAPDGQFDSANKQYFTRMLNSYRFSS